MFFRGGNGDSLCQTNSLAYLNFRPRFLSNGDVRDVSPPDQKPLEVQNDGGVLLMEAFVGRNPISNNTGNNGDWILR